MPVKNRIPFGFPVGQARINIAAMQIFLDDLLTGVCLLLSIESSCKYNILLINFTSSF
jgi:hypothetical protein